MDRPVGRGDLTRRGLLRPETEHVVGHGLVLRLAHAHRRHLGVVGPLPARRADPGDQPGRVAPVDLGDLLHGRADQPPAGCVAGGAEQLERPLAGRRRRLSGPGPLHARGRAHVGPDHRGLVVGRRPGHAGLVGSQRLLPVQVAAVGHEEHGGAQQGHDRPVARAQARRGPARFAPQQPQGDQGQGDADGEVAHQGPAQSGRRQREEEQRPGDQLQRRGAEDDGQELAEQRRAVQPAQTLLDRIAAPAEVAREEQPRDRQRRDDEVQVARQHVGQRSAERKPRTSAQRSGNSIRLMLARKMNGMNRNSTAPAPMAMCSPFCSASRSQVY